MLLCYSKDRKIRVVILIAYLIKYGIAKRTTPFTLIPKIWKAQLGCQSEFR